MVGTSQCFVFTILCNFDAHFRLCARKKENKYEIASHWIDLKVVIICINDIMAPTNKIIQRILKIKKWTKNNKNIILNSFEC